MACVLVNPPEVIPDAIPLSIATIAGALREDRVAVHLDDMNQRFLNEILSRKEFLSSGKELTQELHRLLSQNIAIDGYEERIWQLRQALFKGDLFSSKIAWAKHVLKNWNEEYNYNDYRLAEQIRNLASEVFFLRHQDYLKWSGGESGESGVSTLSDLYESIDDFPDEMLSFLELSISRYERFWEKHEGPAVLGVAARSVKQLQWGCVLAKLIRQRHPKVKFIVGGSFLSFSVLYHKYDYQRFAPLFKFFDAIVIHDGESAVREIYQKFQKGDDLLDCKNTISVVGKSCVIHQPVYVEKLEELPLPYFGTLNFNNYLSPFPVIPYAPTRGCPFKCAYCNYNLNHYHRYRYEDPNSVVRKIIMLKKKYRTSYFYWSVSVLPASYAEKLGEELVRQKAGIRWFCQTRSDKGFTRKVCDTLYRSGARYIELGVESVSDRVLRKMKKENTERDVQRTVTSFSRVGIPVDIFIIVNHPGESVGDFRKTMAFLESNQKAISSIGIQQFFLSAGSYIWSHPEQYGIKFKKRNDNGEVVFWETYSTSYDGGVPLRSREKKREIAHLFMLQSAYYPRLDEGAGSYFFRRYGMVSSVQHQFLFSALGLSAEKFDYTSNLRVRWQLVENCWKALPMDVHGLKVVGEIDEFCGPWLVVNVISGEGMVLERTEMELFLALRNPLSPKQLSAKAEHIYNVPRDELESEIKDVMKYWYKVGFLKRVDASTRRKL